MIGPNAVLQLLPLVPPGLWDGPPPSDHGLMEEAPAARLHRAARGLPGVLTEVGERTGACILAHRIPKPAQVALRLMPRPWACRALTRAIAAHAWTFAGSGRFAAPAPGVFVLHDNPLIRGETSGTPLCHWHAAVFQTLFRALVDPRATCTETHCAACGDPACRFVVTRPGRSH